MMTTLIFSKDRAMQLDALLQSVEKYVKPHYGNVVVLYNVTDREHSKSYEILKREYLNVFFIPDNNRFEQHVKSIIDMDDYITLMVDDMIYFDYVPDDLPKPWWTISNRLGKNINNKAHEKYTISTDGNIYRSKDLLNVMETLTFDNPNTMESLLVPYQPNFKQKVTTQKVVSFAHNRVSDRSGCRFSGMYKEDDLRDQFLAGFRIDIDRIDYTNITSPHVYDRQYIYRRMA